MEVWKYLKSVDFDYILCEKLKCERCFLWTICKEIYDSKIHKNILKQEYKKMMVLKWRDLVNEKPHK
jgi:hypothetical protein